LAPLGVLFMRFLAGIEFGIGIWLGMVATSLLVMASMYVVDLVGRFCAKLQNRDTGVDRVHARDVLWTSTLEPDATLCHPGSRCKVLVRTMIAWSDLRDRELRRKELREER
jgi:hypothetical protein